jgi:hypothetical protein
MCVVKVKGGGHRRIVIGETHHHPGRTDGRLAGRRCGRQTTDDAGEVTPSGRGGRGQRERQTERERRTEETKSGARTERREEASEGGAFLFCFVLGEDESCVVVVVVCVCVCVRASGARVN